MEEKKRNPNFIYLNSESLKMELAISKKTGDVFSADGVKYTAGEITLFAANGITVTPGKHKVKKLFGGEFVGCEEPEMETNDNNNTALPPGTGAEARSEELDIY